MLLILQGKHRFPYSAIGHGMHGVYNVYITSAVSIKLCSSWFMDPISSFISFEYVKCIYVKDHLHY